MNCFQNSKKEWKKKEEREREQRMKEEKIIEEKIKEEKIKEEKKDKIVLPLDLEELECFEELYILFMNICKKKRFILNFFNRLNSDVLYNNCNDRPSLYELERIIRKTIPEYQEDELKSIISHLQHTNVINPSRIYSLSSKIIIDTLYNFCKSLDDTELAL